MKTYKARKSGFFILIVCAVLLLPVLIYNWDPETFSEKPFILLLVLAPAALLLWAWFDTGYKIENGVFFYRSAFLSGKIPVSKIREIEKNATMWSGIKPATATKGMIIFYDRFEEIYVSPQSNDELTADLLEINPEIKIK